MVDPPANARAASASTRVPMSAGCVSVVRGCESRRLPAKRRRPGFSTVSARRRPGTGPAGGCASRRWPADRETAPAAAATVKGGAGTASGMEDPHGVGRRPRDLPRRDFSRQPVLDFGDEEIRRARDRGQPHDRAGHDVGVRLRDREADPFALRSTTRRIQSPSRARPWPASSTPGKLIVCCGCPGAPMTCMPDRNRLVFGEADRESSAPLRREAGDRASARSRPPASPSVRNHLGDCRPGRRPAPPRRGRPARRPSPSPRARRGRGSARALRAADVGSCDDIAVHRAVRAVDLRRRQAMVGKDGVDQVADARRTDACRSANGRSASCRCPTSGRRARGKAGKGRASHAQT